MSHFRTIVYFYVTWFMRHERCLHCFPLTSRSSSMLAPTGGTTTQRGNVTSGSVKGGLLPEDTATLVRSTVHLAVAYSEHDPYRECTGGGGGAFQTRECTCTCVLSRAVSDIAPVQLLRNSVAKANGKLSMCLHNHYAEAKWGVEVCIHVFLTDTSWR
jgi:Na+-translocating ferredoxin:NAD+ oxidoreductase RnfC subunit